MKVCILPNDHVLGNKQTLCFQKAVFYFLTVIVEIDLAAPECPLV